MKWKRWTLISGAVFLTGVIGYCVARTPNFDALKAQGNTLVQQIQAYRATHGEYPQSLEKARIKAPLTFFGRWKYTGFGADSFELSLGDYSRDDFELRYRPDSDWSLDD